MNPDLKDKKIRVLTPTQEEYNQVVQCFFENGFEWRDGDKVINSHYWNTYKENTVVSLNYDIEDNRLSYGDKNFWSEQNTSLFTIYTAQEFLAKYATKPFNSLTNIPMKLNSMMKKLLDKATKTLVKADYINGDLQLTPKGKEALDTLVFEQHKETLVKMAEEDLKEEKKKS